VSRVRLKRRGMINHNDYETVCRRCRFLVRAARDARLTAFNQLYTRSLIIVIVVRATRSTVRDDEPMCFVRTPSAEGLATIRSGRSKVARSRVSLRDKRPSRPKATAVHTTVVNFATTARVRVQRAHTTRWPTFVARTTKTSKVPFRPAKTTVVQ